MKSGKKNKKLKNYQIKEQSTLGERNLTSGDGSKTRKMIFRRRRKLLETKFRWNIIKTDRHLAVS